MKNTSTRRLIREKDVCMKISCGRAVLWRKMKEGAFPKPIKIADGRVAWWEEEVEEWLKNQKHKPISK